jgi:hypothetical protein
MSRGTVTTATQSLPRGASRSSWASRRPEQRQRRDRPRDRPAGEPKWPRSSRPATPSGSSGPRRRSARRAPRPSTPPILIASSGSFEDPPTPVDHVLVAAGGPYCGSPDRNGLRGGAPLGRRAEPALTRA